MDNAGRSLLSVRLMKSAGSEEHSIDVWVDTGFTGDLVLPQSVIERLKLEKSGSVDAILADGSLIELNTFSCEIEWFGRIKPLEIIANDGDFPLLGVGLLLSLELRVDYRNLTVHLTTAKA